MNYEAQLRHKAEILRETLRRTAKLELQHEIQLHPSPPWNYRNRTRMQVRHTPEFALGYYRYNSHDVLPVESCPISSPLINQAIAAVWTLGREKAIPESLHGLQFFANHDDTQLLVEAYVRPGSDPKELQPFAAALHSACQRWREWSFSRSPPSKTKAASARRSRPLIPKCAGHRRRFAPLPRCGTRIPGQRRLVLSDQSLPDRQAGAES